VRLRVALVVVAACGSSHTKPTPAEPPTTSWEIPAGWKSETIPFPLDFAPSLSHRGVEELRFPPGMFDPAAPGYWSYVFAWRLDDPAALDAAALGGELTAYFRGLIRAVDSTLAVDPVTVTATAEEDRFALTAHVIDAFKTKQPVDLVGWARRTPCGGGAREKVLWVIVLARADAGVRGELDRLANAARCGQPASGASPP